MNIAPDQTIILGLQIYQKIIWSKIVLDHLKINLDQLKAWLIHSELYVGRDGMDGWDSYHRS